jgi:hypothetical protein
MGDAPRRDGDLIERSLRDASSFLHYPAINCRATFVASLRLSASLAVTPYSYVDAHARGPQAVRARERSLLTRMRADAGLCRTDRFRGLWNPWFLKIREFQDLATTYALRRRAAIPPVLGH